MKRHDTTDLGGGNRAFEETWWTEILHARSPDTQVRRRAVANISARYWKPVYSYVRCRRIDPEKAKDLVQGFFAKVVLGRNLIGRADPAEGRFRTYLLTALDRYMKSVHRETSAKKRAPEGGLLHLEGFEDPALFEPVDCSTPEMAFHRQWVSGLLDQAIAEVREWYLKGGKEGHWNVFRAVVLAPILEDAPVPSLAEVSDQFGIGGKDKAEDMLLTVKRRFQKVLRNRVRLLVASDDEVDREIREMTQALS